jgi:hypothetical protein
MRVVPDIDKLPQHIAEKIWPEPNSGCWLWGAATVSTGYGQLRFGGRHWPAHRLVWELLVGAIGDGLVIDHLCRNRACVNPAHLEPVTFRENILRGDGVAAHRARRTHCKCGRGYDLIGKGGGRRCSVCRRDVARANAARNKDRRNTKARAAYAERKTAQQALGVS